MTITHLEQSRGLIEAAWDIAREDPQPLRASAHLLTGLLSGFLRACISDLDDVPQFLSHLRKAVRGIAAEDPEFPREHFMGILDGFGRGCSDAIEEAL